MSNDYQEINLTDLFKKIFKYWWLFVLLAILFAGVSYYYTTRYISPLYQTTATLFIGKELNDDKTGISETIRQGTSLVEDYKQLVKTDQVLEKVVKELDLDLSVGGLRNSISVESSEGSRFIYISSIDTNPERVAIIVNKLSEVLKQKAEEVVKVKNVYIVDYAKTPYYPISPNLQMNMMVASLLGLMVAGFIVILTMLNNHTFENESEIEQYTGLPILGVIPKFKGGSHK